MCVLDSAVPEAVHDGPMGILGYALQNAVHDDPMSTLDYAVLKLCLMATWVF